MKDYIKQLDILDKIILVIVTAFLLSIIVFASSCHKQIINTVTVKDSLIYREHTHDSIINVMKMDSSMIRMNFKCDSLGNIYISKINELEGREIKTKVVFRDNMIYIKCEVDSMAVAVKWSDKVTSSSKSNVVTNTIIKETNKLTQWQILQMWGGRLLALILFVIVSIFVIKKIIKKPII